MARYGLICLLLGAVAWAQAPTPAPATQQPAANPAPQPAPATPAQSHMPDPAKVPPDAPIITINGLCDNPPADKTSDPNCKILITRAQFEKVISAIQPAMPAHIRRQFAVRYVTAVMMAKKAEAMGLDKGPVFEEDMKLARIQVLSKELNQAIQDKASQISDQDIEDYYNKNRDKFEEADLERIQIPKTPETPAAARGKKLSEAEEQTRAQQDEKKMKVAADKLHARAVDGEDFKKLQAEASRLSGTSAENVDVAMDKTRRPMLPADQASVMDLKPGEVSPVLSNPGEYFIYKMKTRTTLPLAQVRDEIKNTMRSERIQAEMRAAQESGSTTYDETYFGPQLPVRGMPPIRPARPPVPEAPTSPPEPK